MRSWCYSITINLLREGRLQYVWIDHKRVVLAVGLSHLPLLSGYDEPTTFSDQITLFGTISADDPIFLADPPHDPPVAVFHEQQNSQPWTTTSKGQSMMYGRDYWRAQLGI
jgi:hypothetical protein